MPRPRKWRRVCCLPENERFGPMGGGGSSEIVTMSVDEYETIRLIDLEGLNQEQCARQMDVARTTVQGIYVEARRKIADAIVNGKALVISGGEYSLCSGPRPCCRRGNCPKHKKPLYDLKINDGGTHMKLMIPVDETGERICPSFGRTPYFGLYNIDTGSLELLENPAAQAEGGAGVKAAQFVVDNHPYAILTPRAGENAAELLLAAEIKLYKTSGDSVADAIKAYKAGELPELTEFHAGFMHG